MPKEMHTPPGVLEPRVLQYFHLQKMLFLLLIPALDVAFTGPLPLAAPSAQEAPALLTGQNVSSSTYCLEAASVSFQLHSLSAA